jgi:hypothetical protein
MPLNYEIRVKTSPIILACFLLIFNNCVSDSSHGVAQPTSPTPVAVASNVSDGASERKGEEPTKEASADDKQAGKKVDACKLLKKEEIRELQGERVKQMTGSDRINGPFLVTQCFYAVESFTKSVSLEVTRSAPGQPADRLNDFWREKFQEAKDKKKSDKPKLVPDIGDQAFWTGNAIAGALYVLKKNTYLRISLGGQEEESVKIRKSSELARKALKRL